MKFRPAHRAVAAASCLTLLTATAAPGLARAQQPASAAPAPAAAPFKPDVNDPLLAPMTRAEQEVGTWDEALGLVRQRSTDERSAQANVERAQGRWRQSLAPLLPNARLSAGVGYDLLNPDTPSAAGGGSAGGGSTANPANGAPTVPFGTASVTLTQSLLDLGGYQGVASASASRRSAQATLADTRRRLTLGLARTLVAVVAAERVAELNRLGLRQALERAALTQRTAQLGAATQLDVVRVQQDVEVARGTLIAGDEQLRRTREALGLALGFEHEVGVRQDFGLQGLVVQALSECAAVPAAGARPDVVAAKEAQNAAAAARRQAVLGYLPTVGLTSNLFAYTKEPGFGRFSTWNIGAVLTVPLWEGGLREGLTRERAGAEQQAAAQLESASRNASLEGARARRGVGVAEQLLDSARGARELAARTDEMTRRSFEIGRASSLELVQTAAALRQADVALASREFELVQARLDAVLTEATCNW